MPEITLNDGVLSAQVYVQVTRNYSCTCGANFTITLNMPENVIFNSQISIDKNCPQCNQPIVIPKGEHYVENYKLLTKES